MRKVRLGFIGAGFISQLAHLPTFYSDKRVKITAICDVDKNLLNKVSKKFQIEKTYTSHKEMLKKEKLDAIIVVVNRHQNEIIAKEVLKAKIALFSEKPAALSYLSAKKLTDLARKNRTKYVVGYMKRYDNGILFLKQNLDKFGLGNLLSVYYQIFQGDSYANPFEYFQHKDRNYRKKNSLNKNFNTKKIGFLKYLNSFCHSVNLLRYFFKDIKLEYKKLSNNGEGCVFFKTKKNSSIILNSQFSKSKRWIENINLNFEKGMVTIKMPTPLLKNSSAEILIENYEKGKILKPHIPWGWSFQNQARSFINYIITNKKSNSQSHAIDCLDDIKIIENIFNR